MKEEEKIVFKYLSSLGFNNITYEPLGSCTFPDFGIDGRIGVEVRRLNRNHINKEVENLNNSNHNIDENLNMKLIKDSFDCDNKFKFNGIELSFFLIQKQYEKDIQFCINDKQKKIDALNDKTIFSQYWLVLIDYLFQDDLMEYKLNSLELKDFSRVIIIDKYYKNEKIIYNNKLKENL